METETVLMQRLFLSILFILTLNYAYCQQRISIAGGVHQSSISPYWSLEPEATSQILQKKSSIHIGFIADMKIAPYSNWYFQPSILYNVKGAKQQQVLDTSVTKVLLYSYNQSIKYIDLPMNLVYKFPSSNHTRFVTGAGPMASLFLSGSTSHSSLETSGEFTLEIDRDLPIGKGSEQFKVLYWGFNILAGLEFGKAYLLVNYSKGFNPYYQKGGHQYKHTTAGITLGIFLKDQKQQELKVTDGIYECPEWW
jgi:hypothetical protein